MYKLIKSFIFITLALFAVGAHAQAPSFLELNADSLEIASGDRSLINIHLLVNPTNPGQEIYIQSRIAGNVVKTNQLSDLEFAAFSNALTTVGTNTWRVEVFLQDIEKARTINISIIKLEDEITKLETLLDDETDPAARSLLQAGISKNHSLISTLKAKLNQERVLLEAKTLDIQVVSALSSKLKSLKSGVEPLLIAANKENLAYLEGEVAVFTSTVTTDFTFGGEVQEALIINKLKGKRLGVTKSSEHIFLASSEPFTKGDVGSQQFVSELYIRSLPRSNSIRGAVENGKLERARLIRLKNETSDPFLRAYYTRKVSDISTMIDQLYVQLDSIKTKVTDKRLTISIQVQNTPPVLAEDVQFSLDEDSNIAFQAPVATDADGDELNYIVVGPPLHGTLSGCFQGGRNCTYTPNANYAGSDFITYKVYDGIADSTSIGTISFVINEVNDAPIAGVNQIEALNQDELLSFTVSSGTDLDGDVLTYIVKMGPTNGSLENCFSSPGLQTCSYRPNSGFSGQDTFTYVVRDDENLESQNIATVTLNINGRPSVATDDNVSVNEDSSILITVSAGTDPEGSPLSYSVVSPPIHGTLSNCFQGRNCEYIPNENFNGADLFTYKVNDGALDSESVATVFITVNDVNDLPVFNTTVSNVTTDEDFAVSFNLPSASDIDGNSLTYSLDGLLEHGQLTGCLGGTDSLNCSFTPAENFFGDITFSYIAHDGTADSQNSVMVTITVNPVNDLPVPGVNQSFDLIAGETLAFEVSEASDVDQDSSELSYIVLDDPENGVLSSDCFTTGRSCSYTPNNNFSGTDSFTYRIADGLDSSVEIATITFNVESAGPVVPSVLAIIRTPGLPAAVDVMLDEPAIPGNFPIASYEFNFGDNNTITLPASVFNSPEDVYFTHEYASAGTYTASIVAIDTSGERSDEVTTQIVVAGDGIPYPKFTYSVTDTGSGFEVVFDGSMTVSQYPVSEFRWRYGDDSSDDRGSNLSTVSHTYTDTGIYNVRLRVTDSNNGRQDFRIPIYVGVQEQNINPIAFISPLTNLRVEQGEQIQVSALESFDQDGDNLSYEWIVEDPQGDGSTINGDTLSYTFKRPGTYPILLRAIDSNGGVGERYFAAYVAYPGNFNFEGYATAVDPTSRTVEFQTYYNNYFADISFYEQALWDFGDGSYALGTFVNHQYASNDVYGMSVKIRTPAGSYWTSSKTINVAANAVVPDISLDVSGTTFQVEEPIVFTPETSNPDGSSSSFFNEYSFGDGGWTRGWASYSYTFYQTGFYTNFVITTNNFGFSNIAASSLEVSENSLPTPAFSVTHLGGTSIYLDAQNSFDKLGSIASYNWTIGGTSYTSQNVFYNNSIEGTFDVTLEVEDSIGQTQQFTRKVTIDSDQDADTSSVKAISAGKGFTCVQHINDQVRCWGEGDRGQLATGLNFSIGMGDSNFGLWKTPSRTGYIGLGGNPEKIKTGYNHACALRDGTLFCWGQNDHGQLGNGSNDDLFAVDTNAGISFENDPIIDFDLGRNHTCALTDSGKLYCWGDNSFGQLGYGDTLERNLPSTSDISLGGTATKVVLGGDHSCVQFDDLSVKCWGRNQYGQLGLGDTLSRGDNVVPGSFAVIDVDGASSVYDVEDIKAGGDHTCVLLTPKAGETVARAVRCFGRGEFGQLGQGSAENLGDDEQIATNVGNISLSEVPASISLGDQTTCVLSTTKNIQCFGLNDHGQLGLKSTYNVGDNDLPSEWGVIQSNFDYIAVAAGKTHTCAVTTFGAVKCWGEARLTGLGLLASDDAIGNNEFIDAYSSVNLSYAGANLTAVGPAHICNRSTGGEVRCWGKNNKGQLGYGHTTNIGNQYAPFAAGNISIGGPAQYLAVGGEHSCAVLYDGSLKCWGDNSYGQLGINSSEPSVGDNEEPSQAPAVQFGADYSVEKLALGRAHTCALLQPTPGNLDQTQGKVLCWGDNTYGQLGIGSTDRIGDDEFPSTSSFVNLGGSATDIKSYGDYTCVIRDDEQLVCWGRNDKGQLGLGNTQNLGDEPTDILSNPIQVGGTENKISLLSVGASHTCVQRKDTTEIVCFGDNTDGQLGQGNTSLLGDDELPSSITAISLGSVGNITSMELGSTHTCIAFDGNQFRCFGNNSKGQLGIGSTEMIGDDELPSAISAVTMNFTSEKVYAGDDYSCIGYPYGELRCWGNGLNGVLGRGVSEVYGDDASESIANLWLINIAHGEWLPTSYGPIAESFSSWIKSLARDSIEFWKNGLNFIKLSVRD